MTARLTPTPIMQFFDAAGVPLVGGKLYSFVAGTTTPLITYTTEEGNVTNTNPVILNARGEASVWLGVDSGPYKLVLMTATGETIWTADNIEAVATQSDLTTSIADVTAQINAAIVQINNQYAASSGASLVGYVVNDVNAVATTVQSKIREEVSIRDFGAMGDGTDQTTKFENFAAYLAAHPEIKGRLNGGNYLLTEHVYLGNIDQVVIDPDVNYTSSKVGIISGQEVGHDRNTLLRAWPDWYKLTTYRRLPLNFEFHVDNSMNNQGLTYWNGYYYVGYDIGGGNGLIQRYTLGGILDTSYGNVSVPTNHTAELGYRVSNGRVYAASGGGLEPTYVYELAADGKSVTYTYDFTAYGNSALLAIDNDRDILILFSTQTGGDTGNPTFRFIDWNSGNNVFHQFTIPYQGIPQGLDVYDGIIYYYTNNKVTLIDYNGNILDFWTTLVAGESEGFTVVHEYGSPYFAVGYNTNRRIYSIRTPDALSRFRAVQTLGSWNNADITANNSVSLRPTQFSCMIEKQGTSGGVAPYGWVIGSYTNQIYIDVLETVPTVTTTEVTFTFKRVFWQSIAAIHATEHYTNPYIVRVNYNSVDRKIYIQLLNFSGTIINPQTAVDNRVWITIFGGLRIDGF